MITQRYQAALLPIAAVWIAAAAVWIADRLTRHKRAPRVSPPIIVAAGLAAAMALLVPPLLRPPPEPTFRLEYAFFRRNLARVPRGCRIVRVGFSEAARRQGDHGLDPPVEAARRQGDHGLDPPAELSFLLGLDHEWVPPSATLDTRGCLAYWRPASCRAADPSIDSAVPAVSDCALIERAYRLDPIAETALPARPGLAERYLDDPITVGFYRLHAR